MRGMFSGKFWLFLLALGFFPSFGAYADSSNHPILYVVSDSPGSHVDEMSRRQQPELKELLKAPVVITYQTGGNSSSGWAYVARSRPEGYIISSMILPRLILNPLVRKNAGYDPDELLPLIIYQSIPIGLAVQPDHPAKSLENFINFARLHPRQVKIGIDARYSIQYLALYQFQKLAGIELTTVIFAGPAKQMAGFRSKQVEAVMARSSDLLAHGKELRVLAIGTQERVARFPFVPTFMEKGIEIFQNIDLGVCLRKGTPPDRVQVLERAFLRIAEQDLANNELRENGFIPMAMGSSQALLRIERMKGVFRQLVAEIDKLKARPDEISR
jgi:tripartite-type tricarboxylate transporter receptor subunit TctC